MLKNPLKNVKIPLKNVKSFEKSFEIKLLLYNDMKNKF